LQCLEQLFPDPPAPVRRMRTTAGASAASASSAKKPKPQIIITLTAKSVSAPKAITICEILKRRIAEQGLYWYQYCALEEVFEEVKPKRLEPKGIPQRDTTRRSSWAGPPAANSPSKPHNRSPLHSPAKPPKMAPLTGPPAVPGRSLSVSSHSPIRAPSRLATRNSARSLRGGRAETPVEPTVDEEDPFGPLPPPPKRTQNDPPVTRAMPVLTIYLSTQRIDDYKELHGEQSNEPSPYNVPLPKEPNKKRK